MYGRFKRSPHLPVAYVVFKRRRRGPRWLLWLLSRSKFDHVVMVGYHPGAQLWTVIQCGLQELRVAPLEGYDLKLSGIPIQPDWPMLSAAEADSAVLRFEIPKRLPRRCWPAQLAPMTCAALIHYATRLGGFPAITPDQLHAKLLAAGAQPLSPSS